MKKFFKYLLGFTILILAALSINEVTMHFTTILNGGYVPQNTALAQLADWFVYKWLLIS